MIAGSVFRLADDVAVSTLSSNIDTMYRSEIHFVPTVQSCVECRSVLKTLNLGLLASNLCPKIPGEIRRHS